MNQKTPYDQEMIPADHFKEMVKRKTVVTFPYGHGGIIHEVLALLKDNAMTLDAIGDKLRVDKKTAYNAISHARQRMKIKIKRYYNLKDRKHYFIMEE